MGVVTRPKPSAPVEKTKSPEPDKTDEQPKPLRSGWDGADELAKVGAKYAENFAWPSDNNLVKFLDAFGPFAAYLQHWINERQGKKSFICLEDDCPLCLLGDRPRKLFAYNVALLSDGPPTVYMLTAGPRLQQKLIAAHKSRRGPLHENYWDLTKTGKLAQTDYGVDRVKPEDLREDWELDVFDVDTQIADLQGYTDSVIYRSSHAELEAVATELASAED